MIGALYITGARVFLRRLAVGGLLLVAGAQGGAPEPPQGFGGE